MRRQIAWIGGATFAAAAAALVLTGAYRPIESAPVVGILAALVAAVLAAAMALVGVLRPWLGVLLLVAAMPVINVARADVSLGPIQVLPATVIIVALGLGVMVRRSSPGAATPPGRPALTWILLGGGGVLAVAASLASPVPGTASNITLHGVLEPMAVFAIVAGMRPDGRQVLHALLALTIGVAVATVINFAWLWLLVGDGDLYRQRMLFARLTYFNVGIFATVLVMAIPAAVAPWFLRERGSWWRSAVALGAVAIGLIVGALFFTYTKSAWLSAALVAALLVLLLVSSWRRRVPLLLGIAVMLAVVVPYPLPLLRMAAPGLAAGYEAFLVGTQGVERVESWDPDTYNGSGSISIRLDAIGAAAEITAGSPLLGVGPGGFQREFARIRPDASVPELQSAHNLLPNLAAEYGLPLAVLAAIGLLLVIWRSIGLRREATPLLRVTGVAVGLSLLGFLAMATLFGNDVYRAYRTMNADVITTAMLAGLGWSLAGLRSRKGSSGSRGATPEAGQPVDEPADLGAAGGHEGERAGA